VLWLKIALNAVRLPKFQLVNGISWSLRTIMVKGLRQRSGLAWFCACAESCMVFHTGPYNVLPDNSILITANMQSETGFPSSHQLKCTSPLSPGWNWRRAVLSADAGLLVLFSFAMNWNEQRIVAFLTEKCCYLNLQSKVHTQLRWCSIFCCSRM